MRYNTNNRWARTSARLLPTWANLALAVWLFLSPWLLQFAGNATSFETAAWNAWILGVAIGLVALLAVNTPATWTAWVNLALGAWVFVSPWVLGFAAHPRAGWDHWIVGLLVALFAMARVARPDRPERMATERVDTRRAGEEYNVHR